ncbi:hypothetical protein P7C70_g8991, partial [Phenoliferia sp. Uapishka_3]
MNVLHSRQSAPHDSAWTMPPAYAGQPLYTYEQQQAAFAYAPTYAPHVSSRHFPSVPAFYPSYAPQYPISNEPSPAVGHGYYHQQQQQPQHSRHAFAAYPQQRHYDHPIAPPPYHPAEQQAPAFGYSPFGHPHQPTQEFYGGSDPSFVQQNRRHWQQEASLVGGEPSHVASRAPRTQTYSRPRPSGDLDHPSYDRPPHRSSSQTMAPQVVQPQVAIAPKADLRPIAADNVEYDLISNTSTVPPPPTIELSAVPLADLATEMVWEACILGAEMNGSRDPSRLASFARMTSKPASLFGEVSNANILLRAGSAAAFVEQGSRSQRSVPRTPELYGAIGEGRARKVSSDSASSDCSSPSSSAPGTPAGVDAVEAVSAKKQRLAGLGFGYGSVGDNKLLSEDDYVRAGGLDSPVDAIRICARRLSTIHAPTVIAPPTLPTEPTVAFRQFVKQILTATLLAPEDLVLALYYVARLPSMAMIAPLPADKANSNSAKASAVKAAPFKILLGALMIANKTLQDNSYRNETFASVSGIPLKDVNELELYLFGALKYDVSVGEDIWRTWVGVVRQRINGQALGDLGDRYEVDLALQRLLRP